MGQVEMKGGSRAAGTRGKSERALLWEGAVAKVGALSGEP